jgi:hypothetical protein
MCCLWSTSLPSATEDVRERHHLRKAQNGLQFLQRVAWNDYLITGQQINRVRPGPCKPPSG